MTKLAQSAKGLQDRKARMRFRDGGDVIGTVRSVVADLDGSEHLIYDEVVWSSEGLADPKQCWYSNIVDLVSIEAADGLDA